VVTDGNDSSHFSPLSSTSLAQVTVASHLQDGSVCPQQDSP
jgi:hypothetical protein